MKKWLCCALGFWVAVFMAAAVDVNAKADSSLENISAQSAVLISADTAAVLYEKNARDPLAMASTTKIMTALLALEEAERSGDPVVEITEEMVAVEGSSMGLLPGNRISLSGLAAGMLMASGNDAANSAALYLGGSQEGFAEQMNARAAKIGMKDTHFVTPSGLDDEEHFSTACDMALLAREALKNQGFSQLAACSSYQVEFQEPAQKVTYSNHNKLLKLYEGCIGVKTGFTKKAGRCLVSAAEREGVRLIAVTLNAPDDWNDHIAMLDYGFSTVKSISFDGSGTVAQVPVAGGIRDSISVRGASGGSVSVPAKDAERIKSRVFLPAFLYAPVKAGDKVGTIQYYLGDTPVYSVPVFAQEDAACQEMELSFWEKLFRKKDKG